MPFIRRIAIYETNMLIIKFTSYKSIDFLLHTDDDEIY